MRRTLIAGGTALGIVALAFSYQTSTGSPLKSPSESAPTNEPGGAGDQGGQLQPVSNGWAPVDEIERRTIVGEAVEHEYGTVQVAAIFEGDKLVDVNPLVTPRWFERSIEGNSKALPKLRESALKKQSADIDIVSGASLSSMAYRDSLQAAFDQIGKEATATHLGKPFTHEYGTVQVEATFDHGRLVDIKPVQIPSGDPTTDTLNETAIPQLFEYATKAGDTDFDMVSGASLTSQAYKDSLQSAIDAYAASGGDLSDGIPKDSTDEVIDVDTGAGDSGGGSDGGSAPTDDKPAEEAPVEERTLRGPSVGHIYGTVQVSAVLEGDKLVDVKIIQQPDGDANSLDVSKKSLPKLVKAAVEKQSPNVDLISGASMTSNAFVESLQGALAQK